MLGTSRARRAVPARRDLQRGRTGGEPIARAHRGGRRGGRAHRQAHRDRRRAGLAEPGRLRHRVRAPVPRRKARSRRPARHHC